MARDEVVPAPQLRLRRTERVEVRMHPVEKEAIRAAACAVGLTPSDWVRMICLTAAGVSELRVQLERVVPAKERP